VGKYVDLHVIPPPDDKVSCERMAELLSTAHFTTVGLTISTGLLNERIKLMRRTFEEHGVNTALRVDLCPSSRAELLRLLRRFRNLYDVVAVKCLNQQVATVSCRDRRVDVVFFDAANRSLRFSHSFARLLHGAIEFNVVSDLMDQHEGTSFSRVRRAIRVATEHHVKVLLSSGARSYEMVRSPFQISGLATSLGLNQHESIRGVSSMPLSIITGNREKRTPAYVEEGVKIVVPPGR
jgi:RNase P/RNase MRP subunit p30